MRAMAECRMGDLDTYVYPGGYDSTKLGLGPLMVQSEGPANIDKWAGPFPILIGRPMEAPTTIPAYAFSSIAISSTIEWVFFSEQGTATTRRVLMYIFDKSAMTFSWSGFITLTFPAATSRVMRAITALRDLYTTGTVEVSGTAVTGTGTAWQTARFANGARIGFGTTDPLAVTEWYEISSIDSDTGITLVGSAGTISAGTPFVIEELRIAAATTSSTATNGGLHLVKGLHAGCFQPGGLTIAAAVSTDNVRAVFWLADAATVTNTTACSLACQTKDSNTQHYAWIVNGMGTANGSLYKYNLRAALTVASGKSTDAFELSTGVIAVGGNISSNGLVLATTSHGTGSGVNCLYFSTTSNARVIRTIAISSITTGSTNWVADVMAFIPPGGASTYTQTGSTMQEIYYSPLADAFVVRSTFGMAWFRYVADGFVLRLFGLVDYYAQNLTGNQNVPKHIALQNGSTVAIGFSSDGMAFAYCQGGASNTNAVWVVPLSADWDYADETDCRIVTPEIETPNCDVISSIYLITQQIMNDQTSAFGIPCEAVRVYYRLSGISDNSGTWILASPDGQVDAAGAASIQFMLEFRLLGPQSIPNRVFAVGASYDTLSTDSHYQPSIRGSNGQTPAFAWRFSTAFGTTVPELRVRLYNAVTGDLLVDDSTGSATGTFERSTDDGVTWSAWNNTDKGNETTYLRYIPASLDSGINVRALLTQA